MDNFVIGLHISGFDPNIYEKNQDDVAFILENVMERISNDIAYMFQNDGVEEGETNLYSQQIIPFNTTDFFDYKSDFAQQFGATKSTNYLHTKVLNKKLSEFHVKISGRFDDDIYEYDLKGNFEKLPVSFSDLPREEQFRLNQGKELCTSFEIVKYGNF
ncbi:hypothetical protein G7084_04480 [Weissella coleopterorum]|uniref:Uncharacterized protein n=1 Tax=Weissella coleopterorum TaxID=2714949 RepID=A0A6G8B086_9LACO|nr:hypothetical protein [Weissella coleopterorum]QIL50632.1 hypothetical protein G7084_04480 [Weissella coleopterorum]